MGVRVTMNLYVTFFHPALVKQRSNIKGPLLSFRQGETFSWVVHKLPITLSASFFGAIFLDPDS